jgi:Plasmid recombination enzyme
MASQFLHLASYGVKPRKGAKRWECIAGVCAEGARLPNASRHIPFPAEPNVLHGVSSVEAGHIAQERALQARSPSGKRRLYKNGVALLAGVVSYPTPRATVADDPAEHDRYYAWVDATCAWLRAQFGEQHLLSIVEHVDERHYHMHFYVVPTLGLDNVLNINALHPGRRAKTAAQAEGADHIHAERAYRAGMRAWQDDYHCAVSARFNHDRYGPRRARVSRREREAQKRIEEKQARADAELKADRAAFEQEMQRRRAEFDRECSQLAADVKQGSWQTYAKPYADLRAAHDALKARLADGQARYSAEIAALRARLAELEPEVSLSLVA